MISLLILSTIWIPLAYYIWYVNSLATPTKYCGLYKGRWCAIDRDTLMANRNDYEAVSIEYTKDGECFVYATYPEKFTTNFDVSIGTQWIDRATVSFDGNESDCTEAALKHAGPQGDFYGGLHNDFDFKWMFPSASFEEYSSVVLKMYDVNGTEIIVDVLKNSEIDNDLLAELHGVHLSCPYTRDFVEV